MTFIKRQHVLLCLMFLVVLIFFSLFAASSSFFFFPEFDFLHCDSLWAVSFLSATFACHNVGRYLRNQRNSTFLSGAYPGFLKRGGGGGHHPRIADYIWFIALLSLVYQRAQSYYRGMKAHIN